MRLGFTTDGVFPQVGGGIARHSLFLVEHLAAAGIELEVFHPGPEHVFSHPRIREEIVERPRYGFPGHYIAELRVYARRVAQRISARGRAYDVGYCQGLSLWGGMGAVPFPCLVNPHGLEFLQPGSSRRRIEARVFSRVFQSAFGEAAGVVSLGGRLTSILLDQGVPSSKIFTLPNGVDLAYVDGFAADVAAAVRPRFVFVGRLVFNKGLPELVKAFRMLPTGSAELVIVGEGELAEQLDVAGQADIRLAGGVDDGALFGLLRSATCFVLPTKGEGMPTAILEAMSCSLPVIASDVGAVAELVSSDNGWLVAPGDVAGLHRALMHAVMADSRTLKEKGAASRRRAEQFAWPRIAERTVEALLQMRSRSHPAKAPASPSRDPMGDP